MKVENENVRQFLLEECVKSAWSTRQLERQINSFFYERLLSSRAEEGVASEVQKLEPGKTPENIIRDPYLSTEEELRKELRREYEALDSGMISPDSFQINSYLPKSFQLGLDVRPLKYLTVFAQYTKQKNREPLMEWKNERIAQLQLPEPADSDPHPRLILDGRGIHAGYKAICPVGLFVRL